MTRKATTVANSANKDPLDSDSVSNLLGRYGSSLSPDTLNNPLGPGNPFDSGSPKNPYGRGRRIEG